MKKINLLIVLLLLFPFLSANGLQIFNQSFVINKTVDNPVNIIFALTNADSFTFYNISPENTNIINFTKIPQLLSGETINVTATVRTNADFNGTINILGFYLATLGTSNITKEVYVKYDSGITPCVLSIIKGDSVIWRNLANRNIVMKNSETNADITSLLQNANYTQQFLEPLVLNYYFSWLGFRFTQICTMTVLNDFGYINNPEYDAKLNLTVDVNFEPTTMQTIFLETNYSMNVYTTRDGIFLLKNIGLKPAKNIHLSNSWFAFSPNDFELAAGSSKTISYVINPIIHNTNDTGKNWEQNILITGNFENVNQVLNVFIPYADISSSNYTGGDSIINLLIKYCNENPNQPMCKTNPTVIYKNGSSGENMSESQFRAILEYWYNEFEGIKDFITWSKEKINNIEHNQSSIAEDNSITRKEVENIKTENQGTTSMIYFIILGVCLFVIIGGGIYLYWYFKRERKNKELRRW